MLVCDYIANVILPVSFLQVHQYVWWEGIQCMKGVLRCTTVDSGIVCAVPHLLKLTRLLQFADNWVMSMLTELQHTTGSTPRQPLSLALEIRKV